MSSLSDMWSTNIFSQSVAHTFTLLRGPFIESFYEIQLIDIFSFMGSVFGVISTNCSTSPGPEDFLLFSSKCSIVLQFILKSMIHFESIVIKWVKPRFLGFLSMMSSYSNAICLKRLSFHPSNCFFIFVRNRLVGLVEAITLFSVLDLCLSLSQNCITIAI